MRFHLRLLVLSLLFVMLPLVPLAPGQSKSKQQLLDDRVKSFLEDQRFNWWDMNIPVQDGQFLHDVIVKHQYTRALEIGTSTGHSAIWIAWALSKTGGKLVTIEIDKDRHRKALENFEKAGLSEFIDARLADAHDLVKELRGPFDFVFSDADKDWYTQYFIDIGPKMTVGGCFTAHNISKRGGELRGYAKEYVDFLKTRTDFETTVESTRSTGIAVSYKLSQ